MRNAKLAVLLLLGLMGSTAYAGGFEGEVGYMYLDTGLSDVSLGSIYGVVGYSWEGGGSYAGAVEFMGGYGVMDDSVRSGGIKLNVDLDSILGVGYRGTMEVNPDLSWYYRAVFTRIDLGFSAGGASARGNESDFGLGAGITYRRITAGFIKYFGDLDGANSIMIGYRF